ncbi:MAG TPA: winged helix-turn-helix domain-containing protein [Blastocatellia bacterium]|nr:winged helix-turn-helix domain-containing protein [Blastocatellia bacterium]
MSNQASQFYEFGRFRVDAGQRLLLRDGEVVPLTPKVFDILLALVQNSGRIVEKDDLMKRVWPDAFVEEGNLTQNISLLRKSLGEGPNGTHYIETIARRGYRFVAAVREARDAGRAAAASEIGPTARAAEATRPELARHPVEDNEAAAQPALYTEAPALPAHPRDAASVAQRILSLARERWRTVLLVAAALVIAAAGIALSTGGGNATNGVIESIAVLPFVNETDDPETQYLNDRITESLINSLSQLPKLRVVPRSVVLGYKGREADPRQIARDLNVRAVLTGRVHRRGDTFSIQADLVDAENVSQIWGRHYDRKLADVLLVQEDISKDIFENLRLKLSVEEKKQLEAYRLYLKGRNYWNKRTAEGLQQGIDYFQQAIEIDSNYAPAYAGLADCYNMLVVYGVRTPKDAFPKAKEAAMRALEIDETLAEAHTSLAFIAFRWGRDRMDTEEEFQLAIRYKPSYAPAHQWYSSYLVAVERFDEAIAEAKRTQELEPLSLITDSHLAWILYMSGRYDQAIEQSRKLIEIDPNFFPARRYLGLAYEQKGMYQEAIAEFDRGVQLSGSPLMVALLGHAYAASGKKAKAREVLTELEQLPKERYVSPYTIAAIYAGLDEKDHAFKWLERAYDERDIWLMNLKVDPVMKNLRSDRRFKDLLGRIGLAP